MPSTKNGRVTLGREAAKHAEFPRLPRLRSLAPVKLAGIAVGLVVFLAILAFFLAVAVFPPGISISPANAATEVRPHDQYLEINTSSWGASVSTVTVMEKNVGSDGSLDGGRLIDGHLQGNRFVSADGSNPLIANARYTVTVTGKVKKLGLTGVTTNQVQETSTFSTVVTPMPVIPQYGLIVKPGGQELQLNWNVPISSFNYQLDGIQSTSSISQSDPKVAVIKLANMEQGKKYPITILSATSKNGAQMNQPVVTTVSTPAPLTVTFTPGDGSINASTDVYPTIQFSEPVANPDIADQVVSVDPKVAGAWSWAAANKLQFVPAKNWNQMQDITVRLAGGPSRFTGVSGGFVNSDQQATFTTAPAKAIDVNVTTETVTLLENGNPIDSFLCASGAASTPTPLGDWTIYAKLPSVDMRGPGYFAPHVPWVMVFDGDYTLHGNYWNTTFGVRGSGGSHGCVGMPPATAKRVYDWAPIGTPVHIHE